MPPRRPLPADDLYACLEIATDASPEAIEVAWRSLLRQHHPDIAGPSGLERAKRINVAHDWLSDPELRQRYDRERGISRRGKGRPAWADPRWAGSGRAESRERTTIRRRPADPAELLALFIERVRALTPDEVDRLACAEPAPIAFGATIARFLPPERLAALEAMEAAVDAALDHAAAVRLGVRDAVEGYGTELVLGPFLDELLTDPFRERARERLTRGWDAAVGQPRYGPNGPAVRALIDRLATLDGAGVAALAAIVRSRRSDPTPDDPWPPGASPDDDEALRVSSILAMRDSAAAVPAIGDPAVVAAARRSAARLAHRLVLRHVFGPSAFASVVAPWRPRFLPEDPVVASVRKPSQA